MDTVAICGLESIDLTDTGINQDSKSLMLLFHGYGADAANLADLPSYVVGKEAFHIHSLEGPVVLGQTFGSAMRAWFPIDMERWQKAQRGEYSPQEYEAQLDISLSSLESTLDSLSKNIAQNYENILLIGFSQGAMVAGELAFRFFPRWKQKTINLALFSTRDFSKRWLSQLQDVSPEDSPRDFRVFVAHNFEDSVINFSQGQNLEMNLRQLLPKTVPVAKTLFHPGPGDHLISGEALASMNRFFFTQQDH